MRRCLFVSILVTSSLFVPAGWAQLSVLSERYDNNRNGANLSEAVLNTTNVNVNQFGKLFTLTVDGSTYAQPLYVPGVVIAGSTHNVLYVATMNDKLYAFDADSNTGGNANPLWSRDFTNASAGVTAVPIADITGSNSLNIVGNVGIESTPVIDLPSNTMYLLARTKENGTYVQRLHAVDIRTGTDLAGSPVAIQGSSGSATFDPFIENQRTSLAIVNGKVLIAWASHEDMHAYHGWVIAYNTPSLTQVAVYCVTPSGTEGGIWNSGWAPAIDSGGNVYFISGNGTWDGTANFGESFLKFSTTSGLSLTDWFTPDNYASLNSSDQDLGASGAMLIPGANLVVGGGKQSIFYLLNTGNLGHEKSGNGQAVQLLNVGGGEIKGGPIYWNRSGGTGPWMYVWAANDHLKAYHFNGSKFDTVPVSQGTIQAPSGTSPGVLTLSANGSTSGSGIVWASIALNQNADHGVVSGILRALNADNLSSEIWNSRLNATRDDIVTWPKWCPPVVVNGKVYMGSFSNKVYVFGLLPTSGNLIADGTYTVTNQHSNMVMDDPGSSHTAGALIIQWTLNNGANQHWQLANLGNNNVKLTNVASGLALGVVAASTAAGAQMEQRGYTGASNQIWHVSAGAGGTYVFTNSNSGLVLEVPGSSTKTNTVLDQAASTGGGNQLWTVH